MLSARLTLLIIIVWPLMVSGMLAPDGVADIYRQGVPQVVAGSTHIPSLLQVLDA